jgi:hypothetical protein
VKGMKSTGNVSQGERPTSYARGGRRDRMLVRPCPCVLKGKEKARGVKEIGG